VTCADRGLQRFDLRYAHEPLPHDHLMRAVELYGKEVIPRTRDHLSA
jgi:hypothetical protein